MRTHDPKTMAERSRCQPVHVAEYQRTDQESNRANHPYPRTRVSGVTGTPRQESERKCRDINSRWSTDLGSNRTGKREQSACSGTQHGCNATTAGPPPKDRSSRGRGLLSLRIDKRVRTWDAGYDQHATPASDSGPQSTDSQFK